MGAPLSQQRPSVSRALGVEWRHSPALGSGAGGRKDLSLGKRESSARAWPRYITFRASSETKTDARGREGFRPRGEPPGQKRLPRVKSGCWEQLGIVPPLPRRAEQYGSNCLRAWGGSGGASLRLAGERNSGRFAQRDSLDSEFRSEGQRVLAGHGPRGPGPLSSYKSG